MYLQCTIEICSPTQDRNGYIENEELHGFLKDLMELVEDVSVFKNLI